MGSKQRDILTIPNVAHTHDAFMCPPHVDNCSCPELKDFTVLEDYICNPYFVKGYCPFQIEVMP